MTDAEIEQALEEQAQREKLALAQRRADSQELLSTPAGRRFAERMVFEYGGLQEQSHHPDPYQRAFNDGQRQVGIVLNRELLLTAPEGWKLMHDERTARIRAEPQPVRAIDQ